MALKESEIKEKLRNLTGWEVKNTQLAKTFRLADFERAMKLVNQIVMIAENLNHHPDMLIQYNQVTFSLSTHSENGITEKDFALAKEIETASVSLV